MLRVTACLIMLGFFAVSASALTVEKFTKRDRLEFHVFINGVSTRKASALTGADRSYVFGFYGYKTIGGRLVKYPVDLHVTNGSVKIESMYNRKVIAQFKDGTVRIFPSWTDCKSWGTPLSAAAGITIPPRPNQKLPRQFWATKGDYFYRVKMVGDRWDCLRIATEWGFDAMVHADGGSSLERGHAHPSHAQIFKNSLQTAAS